MKQEKTGKEIRIRAGFERVRYLAKQGLFVLMIAALSSLAFAQDRQTVTTDGSAEIKQDAGEDSPDHRHRPPTMILVVEQDGKGAFHAWWRDSGQSEFGVVGNVLKDKLIEKGYEMIDHAAVAEVIRTQTSEISGELTINQAKVIGNQVDAEVVIIGKSALKIMRDQNGMKSAQADVAIKAVWVEHGQLIASSWAHATSKQNNELIAGNEALKQAAMEGADRLLEKMSHFCMEHGSTRSVNITITGLDKLQFMKIKESLKSQVRGVKDFQEQSFSGGTAKILVDCTVSAQALLDELVIIDFGSFALEEVNSTPRKLELKVTPK